MLRLPADGRGGGGRPWPLQAIVVTQGEGPGRWSEVIRRWHAGDARACSRCPRALCTAIGGADGQAVCVLRFAGEVADDAAEDVGLAAAASPFTPARRPVSPTATTRGRGGGASTA